MIAAMKIITPGVLIQLNPSEFPFSPAYTTTVVLMSAIALWIGGQSVDVSMSSRKMRIKGLQAFTPSWAVSALFEFASCCSSTSME